jgi:amino-acid N-acetyltransferase
MPILTIESGSQADLPEVLSLLATAGLSGSGVAEQIANLLVAREDGRLVAVAGLEDHRVAGLIRSVAVAPDQRRRGLAGRLVQALIARSRTLGHGAVYLRTQTAEEYFRRFGFRPVAVGDVAPEVLASGQFRGEECESSVTMMLAHSPRR